MIIHFFGLIGLFVCIVEIVPRSGDETFAMNEKSSKAAIRYVKSRQRWSVFLKARITT